MRSGGTALLDADPPTPVAEFAEFAKFAEVAKACGFNATQYFYNPFKRRMGRTPKAWTSREL